MSAIRPYTFDSIPKLSRGELALRQSIEAYISTRPFGPDFEKNITSTITELLKTDLQLSPHTLTNVSPAELQSSFSKIAYVVSLSAGSLNDRILVELDPNIVGLALERILGGTGSGERNRRRLTEVEEGVLSFGVLKILQLFGGSWNHSTQLPLRFDQIVSQYSDLDDTHLGARHYYTLTYRIELDRRLMHLRIILPESLINESVFTTPSNEASGDSEHAHMKKLLASVGRTAVAARVEVSSLNLSSSDIATLEPGDIILVEDHQLTLTPDGVTGEVFVRIGTGENGGLRCQVLNDNGQSLLQITSIVTQEKPVETPGLQGTSIFMTDLDPSEETEHEAEEEIEHETELEEGDELESEDVPPTSTEAEEETDSSLQEGDNLSQTEGLLRDVPAPVVIELSRLQMNTAQIIRLKEGQILRLPRGTQDPVDLVINDKVFARGELIEVDGELGVRLLQLTGA